MLLYLAEYLAQFASGFNVFSYLTMRAILGALTALIISFIICPRLIKRLSVNQIGQPVRADGPETHLLKAGTPTMGGAMILIAISVSTVLWADLENVYIWIVLFVTLSFGVIGYVDDYKKIVLQNPAGISAWQKLFWQSSAAMIAAIALYVAATDEVQTSLLIPYFKDLAIPLGMFQIVVTYFFIVGFSNAVNLTDGLDGLAIMPTVLVGGALGIFALRCRDRRDDHDRLRQGVVVGECHVDPRQASRRRHFGQPTGCAAGQPKGRLSRRQVDDADVAPIDAAAKAGAERLGARLLGGEPLGVAGGAVGPAFGLAPLDLGEHAIEKTVAEPRKRPIDAADVDEVVADAKDHGGAVFPGTAIRRCARRRPRRAPRPCVPACGGWRFPGR